MPNRLGRDEHRLLEHNIPIDNRITSRRKRGERNSEGCVTGTHRVDDRAAMGADRAGIGEPGALN
jgi:hypothetical protein